MISYALSHSRIPLITLGEYISLWASRTWFGIRLDHLEICQSREVQDKIYSRLNIKISTIVPNYTRLRHLEYMFTSFG